MFARNEPRTVFPSWQSTETVEAVTAARVVGIDSYSVWIYRYIAVTHWLHESIPYIDGTCCRPGCCASPVGSRYDRCCAENRCSQQSISFYSACRVHTWSHRQLQHNAHQVAVSLRAHGQAEGCRVAIIGDMTPQAIACYLAVVLVGGAVVSVAPSFSAEEIASRLTLAQTSLVITQVCANMPGRGAVHLGKRALLNGNNCAREES